MYTISIHERGGETDSPNAAVSVNGEGEYPVTVRNPFSPQEEARLEWYFEQHLRFPFTQQVEAQAAAASVTAYGESLFNQVFADRKAYARYQEALQSGVENLRFEIAGSPEFHQLHWEALKDPELPQPLTLQAPMIRRTISLSEEGKAVGTSLIVTAIGADRPGIVSLLSDRAQGFGANWAGSRMANLAGQFAGMVHFEVPPQNAEPLAQALRSLESSGLRVVIEKVETPPAPAGRRIVRLELTGLDRPGIVRDLSRSLAQQGVSIDDLHTEIVDGNTSAEHLFKVKALLVVPETLPNDKLRQALSALANEMMVDIALGEEPAKASG